MHWFGRGILRIGRCLDTREDLVQRESIQEASVSYRDPFGLCPMCGAYAVFEIGASAYDLYDLGKTAFRFFRGRASKTELTVTAAGAGLGLVSFGGGYGKTGRLALSTAESWGNATTLARHFRDHGADFGARNADEYASMASEFLQRAQREGLPTKIDSDGIIRIHDPVTNTFGAYNPNGTTRTLFKPTSPTYFERQPGVIQ